MMLFPVVVIALILFFSLPFMKDKIIELLTETETVEQIISDSVGREVNTTPQRFTSFLITFIDFKNNPVLGLAAHTEDSWTRRVGSSISPISGIGTLLAQFGLVGFIPFILFSIKTSFKFAKHFNYRGKWLLFMVILLISVSYTIIFIPFIMCFWLYSLFETDLAPEGSREVAKEAGPGSSEGIIRNEI
jgi:hypothetical protein